MTPTHFSRTLLTTIVTSLMLASPVFAADLPSVQQSGRIEYLTGGIGSDESNAMKAEARHYPLAIEMAKGREGHYVADVDVAISNVKGKQVFEANSTGPFMLVKLPPGNYIVKATLDGVTKQQKVNVGAQGSKHLSISWPAPAGSAL
ncbi:T9SS type A sorting domain-containing protein [Crenobacter sp. SG2303]|uniref:T9SS type A sorting domain-containing protein n=1 Tax=Crenobacter oryzisoli TaxID=3056844 RepID=A0ABT7XR37_9NEIS|nr:MULTISPECIES: T9SS type A sorting domain-containing protein [unclassified Crenobacter]MDN0076252.1 T9SS type A sorting domain-containing protein [Crenobacter sp. SG2303]MDN0085310.1 T9SS type A sorting domain-containing protein [Crenobacter sp. SG2305]